MKIAFSPCPNDTFVFHAWVHGLIPGAPKLDVTYADIDRTNEWAAESDKYDILKISFAALPWVLDRYTLLPCGGALGNGCGPLVLVSNNSPKNPKQLTGKKIGVPSERSTAYLLFRLWAARNVPGGIGEIQRMPYDQIMPAVQEGDIDAGLVIHEARFTYPSYGLSSLVDLGEWWEEDTGLPIPLGAIMVRRSLDVTSIIRWVQQSVRYAFEHPEESRSYILEHAQEMEDDVVQAHINLYVNRFTENLGEVGIQSIHTLLQRAAEENLVPSVSEKQLRETMKLKIF